MVRKIGRRDFIKRSVKIGFSAAVGSSVISKFVNGSIHINGNESVDIAVVTGSDYFNNSVKAIDLLGGMVEFVKKGSKVALLPNTQSRHPGTYTKPEIVHSVIKMCREAGAKEVNCLSWLTQKHWEETGLAQVVEKAGANLKLIERDNESFYKPVQIPAGKALKEAQIMNEFFECDVFINMPVTKDHAGNKFTGTLKNLMGLNFRMNNRTFHKEGWMTDLSAIEHLDQCIADLNTIITPDLCIVDATEFITTNGPFGPGKLIKPLKIVAGVDRVAIDSYCATLWGLDAKDIIMINKAYEHDLGKIDLDKVSIKEVKA